MKPDQPFGSLWESYVFKMATLVIDSVSPDDQANLIQLIHQADSSSLTDTVLGGEGQPDTENERSSPLPQLARQWQVALKRPLTPRRIRLEGDQLLLRRALRLTQQQIASTQLCLTRLHELIERANRRTPSTLLQTQLLLQYQAIQGRHLAYLAQLAEVQDKQLSQLDR